MDLDAMERDAAEARKWCEPGVRSVVLADHVTALAAEVRRLQQHYGSESANGDVIDWLYAWLREPGNRPSQAVLGIYLARGGYSDAGPLLSALAPPASVPTLRAALQAAWRDEIDRIEADGFVDPPPVVVTETDSCPLG